MPDRDDAIHDLVAINASAWIRIFRHTPDSLYTLIRAHQRLDLIHIGTVLVHSYWYHLDTKLLADGKMAVVTRHGTQKPGRTGAAPYRIRTANAYVHCVQYGMVHQRKTAIASDEYLLRGHIEQISA